MDVYHAWCDLQPGVSDLAFAGAVRAYMEHLKGRELIAGWRLTRRKLGLGAPGLGEFHIEIETRDLAQIDAAFSLVATRAGTVEGLHHDVNSLVRNVVFALYRDFPDPQRKHGEELF